MMQDQPTAWAAKIAQAAVPVLTERGACVVRYDADSTAEAVSRRYDPQPGKGWRSARMKAWAQATRREGQERDGLSSFYVVSRDEVEFIVWADYDATLWHAPIKKVVGTAKMCEKCGQRPVATTTFEDGFSMAMLRTGHLVCAQCHEEGWREDLDYVAERKREREWTTSPERKATRNERGICTCYRSPCECELGDDR